MQPNRKLRIGIDLTGVWRLGTGIFVYAAQLARQLVRFDNENSYTLFFSGQVHPEFQEMEGKFQAIVIPFREEVISKQVLMGAVCNSLRLDLIHFPAFPPPVACFRPFVWTLHDAVPWLYPDTMDLKGRLYFRWVGRWAARFSKAIITDSNDAKRTIIDALRIPESKVRVIYIGIDGAFGKIGDREFLNSVRARYRLPAHFILTVGTLEPRKNFPFLIQAYRRMRRTNQTKLGLVIAGRPGWKLESLQHDSGNESEGIVLTGFVPQADLVALYNLAEVFVLPSLYEGFGLPPLQAMACGCPVIVSNRGSLPEVVGDAGLLIDPQNADSLVAAIRAVEAKQSLHEDLARKGLERVKQFSCMTQTVKTLEVYREAAG